MKKDFYAFLFLLLVLGLVPASSNAGEIRLEWSATSGTGTIGASDISAMMGDQLSLDIIYDGSITNGWVAISLDFSSSPLALVNVTPSTPLDPSFSQSAVEANHAMTVTTDGTGDGAVGLPDLVGLQQNFFLSGTNPYDFNGDSLVNFSDLSLFSDNYGAGSPTAPAATNVLYLSIGRFLNLQVLTANQLIATVDFSVNGSGAGNVNPFINMGIDGVFEDITFIDHTAETSLIGATLNGGLTTSVPEPGTLLLFGLGLAGLGFARRKKT